MEKNKVWFSVMAVLSSVGIILASYLLYNFYNSKPALFCDINDKVNCQAVISGSLATFAGIPVALVGLVGYAVILFSSLTKRKKLALFMTSFGMIFCLRLTILEIFFIKVICPICLACQTIMLVLFLISIYLVFKQKRINEIIRQMNYRIDKDAPCQLGKTHLSILGKIGVN